MTREVVAAPTGQVTFLFTDIVGSTEMWERHGDAFLPVLQAHNAILQDAISRCGGYLIKTEGDAFKVAFADPAAAVRCAVLAQAALQRYRWPPDVGALHVRAAVHAGRPFVQQGDYFGPVVNRTARILGVTNGDQVLVSEEALRLAESRAPAEVRFTDLGYHPLKDLDEPIRLFQVDHPTQRAARFSPLRSLSGQPHNLPVQRTSFIGREREIEQIASLLARGDPPLLTLTGPRGIGKTRLSLQAAAERIEWFPDGVWFVRLSEARDAESAALEVADALDIPLAPRQAAMEAVRLWLASRHCLLILDDCGHIPEVGRFIRELLSGTTSLRCLATSRDTLQVEDGREVPVPGMSLPGPEADAGAVMASEAGRLFVDRVHAERAEFVLTDARARPIARLLDRLGGVPESIERAASMMRTPGLTPGKVLNALGRELARTAEGAGQVAAQRGRDLLARVREYPGLAALLQSVSAAVADVGDLDDAERICREALGLYERMGDRPGMAGALRQLGYVASLRGHHERAAALLSASLKLYREAGAPEAEAVMADLECAVRAAGQAAAPDLPLDRALAIARGI